MTDKSNVEEGTSIGNNLNKNKTKKNLILKFEYDGQQYELSSLTTDDKVGDLRAVICSMLNIDDFDRINLKKLQPTKVIDASDDIKSLSEIFSQTRERIVVEDSPQFQQSNQHQHDHQPHQSTSRASSTSRTTLTAPSQSTSNRRIKSFKSDDLNNQPKSFETPNYNNLHSHSEHSPPPTRPLESISPPSIHDQSNLSSNSTESPVRQRKIPRGENDYPVCSSTGYLLRHPVPSNNSCLFISVHFCLTHGIVDDQIGKSMRKIIAETVASDHERFDDAFLGKSNADYCAWILDDNNWGGAIELSILCKYYETEIVAIDVKNTILNRFGEDSHYAQRMLLLYDGLHYDPLKFQPLDDSQSVKTLFSADNLEILTMAEELAREAKQSHQFTDMNTITMKCTICNANLDAKTASEHASKTGHIDFVEISS